MRWLIDQPDNRSRARWRALAVVSAVGVGFVLSETLSHALAGWRVPGSSGLTPIPSAAWFALASGAGAWATLSRGRVFRTAALVWIVLLAGGWHSARVLEPAPGAGALLQAADAHAIVTLEGVALTDGFPLPPTRDWLAAPQRGQVVSAFDLGVTHAQAEDGWTPVRGRVRVLVSGSSPLARAGAHVRVTGALAPVPAPLNPGEPDRRTWANQRAEVGTLRTTPLLLAPAPSDRASVRVHALSAWSAWRGGLRARAARALGFDGALAGDPGALDPNADAMTQGRALVAAITLGQRAPALREGEAAFQRVGLAHLMAISGFHVVVMTGVLLVMLRVLGDRGAAEPLIAAGLIAVYLTLVPANAPVVRAGVMVIALLLGEALGRRHDRVALLAWVALGVLVWKPLELFALGFQLSFGLTGALLWIGPAWHARLFPSLPLASALGGRSEPLAGAFVRRPFQALISTSTLCWLLAIPIVAAHMGQLSPAGVLATVVMTPIIVLALWLGYLALLVGVVFPASASVVGGVLGAIGLLGVRVAQWFDALPGSSVTLPALSPWTPAILVASVGTLGALLLMTGRGRVGRTRLGLACVAAWMLALAHGAAFAHRPGPGVAMRLDTLAVGDGACHLIRTTRGAVLWDCGSLSGGLGWRTAPRALRALGVTRVRAAVVSHPDLDHFAALADLAPRVGLRDLFVGERFLQHAQRHEGGVPAQLLGRLETLGVRVHAVGAGDVVTIGDLRLRFLHPGPGFAHVSDNEHSLVAIVEHVRAPADGSVAPLLMTGDIESAGMHALRAAHPALRARVVELPHHGSAHPAAYAFVDALAPSVVVQSTGPSRAGDPRWNPVRDGAARWLTTAHDGAASVEWRTDGTLRAGGFRDRAR